MFVHTVYFWLKDDLSAEQRTGFVRELHALRAITSIRLLHIGLPAATHRPVIDRSYSYALVVIFDDAAGHDLYQDHPIHDRFRQTCASMWKKVQIYDSVETA